MKYLLSIFIIVQLYGCCSEPTDEKPAAKTAYHNDYSISRYQANLGPHNSNSYWIEGPDGLVLIDSQFTEAETNALVDIAESTTGKKVVLAIILHASAERTNGIATLKSRGIRVVSSQQVVDELRRQLQQQASSTNPISPEKAIPEAAWQQTQAFDAAGLSFWAYVVQGAVSESHVLVELDKRLFTGDLVLQGHHARPADTAQWLERLEQIEKFTKSRVIYPGRGHSMAKGTLVSRQIAYIQYLKKMIAEFYTGGKITAADIKDIHQRMQQKYPDYAGATGLPETIQREWEQQRLADHGMM